MKTFYFVLVLVLVLGFDVICYYLFFVPLVIKRQKSPWYLTKRFRGAGYYHMYVRVCAMYILPA